MYIRIYSQIFNFFKPFIFLFQRGAKSQNISNAISSLISHLMFPPRVQDVQSTPVLCNYQLGHSIWPWCCLYCIFLSRVKSQSKSDSCCTCSCFYCQLWTSTMRKNAFMYPSFTVIPMEMCSFLINCLSNLVQKNSSMKDIFRLSIYQVKDSQYRFFFLVLFSGKCSFSYSNSAY